MRSTKRYPFRASTIPELSTGYWWDLSQTSGLGTSGFKVPEMNGNTSFDLVQTDTTKHPTLLTERDGVQLRMRKTADSHPSYISTAGSVTAGWTGATYIAGWFRFPDASGAVTGFGTLFSHRTSGASNRRFVVSITTIGGQKQGVGVSQDGTAQVANLYLNLLAGGSWKWLEFIYDPSQPTTANRVQVYSGLNQAAVDTSESGGPFPNSVKDSTAPLGWGCFVYLNTANGDTTDLGGCLYYLGSIPSPKTRKMLMKFRAPTPTSGV